ncbi:MAG: PAS domain S-box protein [Pirellulales bacterium]
MSFPDSKEPLSSVTIQQAREVMHLRQPAFADFYLDDFTKKVYLRLFVPILDGPSGGRPLGVLNLRIDPEIYLYPFIQRWPVPSETAETLLIRREGNEAVFLNDLKFQKNTALTLRASLDGTDLPAAKAALGQEGVVEGVDYRGVPVLAFVRAVPDSPWFLVAKIDAAEVYAPMRERLWLTVLFVGTLLFGLAAAVGFVWRRQHAALYRQKYEAEHKYRAILEASADGILMADVETKVLKYPNPAFCRLLGYTARELRTMTVADILLKDALQNALAEFERLAREGKGLTHDIPCRRKDGTIVYVDINTTKATIDGRKCLVGVFRDTTERKQAEETLREREEWYRTLFVEALDGICLVDAKTGLIIDCNQALTALVGRDKAELIGQSQTVLHPPAEDSGPFSSTFKQHLGDRAGEILDTQVVNRTGEIKEVAIRARILDLAGKQVMQGLFRDITDRKRAEEQLQNYAAELESANKALEESKHLAECASRAKSEFLANMSHEIRTPMTAILGYADLLADENIERAMREHVAVIKRNGEHLLGLINEILDLSKIEAGKMQIEPTRCSLVQLVAEVASLMRPQAAAKQLKLKTDLVGPLPETVLTDPLRLRQVLVNLTGNAIKFTDHQGEVRLAVRLTSDGGPPRLCFDVTDTGIGMSEEQIGKLFQPFSQVDNSSTRKFGGTGLGLCISKHLAEALGGNIEVRSAPGKGSTFSVTINPGLLDGMQLIQNAQEVLLERPPTTPVATPDKIELHGRILLVEDGLDNQRLIRFLLEKAGAEVTAVENGQLAVEAVILMDMQMPVMDGYEATRALRGRGYAGPIVALTAYSMVEDCQKCLDAGCDDFTTKPIDRQNLLATVAHWTARSRTNDESPDSLAASTPGYD